MCEDDLKWTIIIKRNNEKLWLGFCKILKFSAEDKFTQNVQPPTLSVATVKKAILNLHEKLKEYLFQHTLQTITNVTNWTELILPEIELNFLKQKYSER